MSTGSLAAPGLHRIVSMESTPRLPSPAKSVARPRRASADSFSTISTPSMGGSPPKSIGKELLMRSGARAVRWRRTLRRARRGDYARDGPHAHVQPRRGRPHPRAALAAQIAPQERGGSGVRRGGAQWPRAALVGGAALDAVPAEERRWWRTQRWQAQRRARLGPALGGRGAPVGPPDARELGGGSG